MRLLKEVFGNSEKAWIYCANEDLQRQFLLQAESEGFNTSLQKTALSHIYGIGTDGHVGCLSPFLWSISFGCGVDFPRIDYQAFIEGKEDYECKEPHMRRIG